MSEALVEPAAKPTSTALGESSLSAEHGLLPTSFAPPVSFTDGGFAVASGFRDLMEAYQSVARRNGEKLMASMQALGAVKTPAEFVELQRQLLAESVAAAVSDTATIGKLTTAAFTSAFEPMRKQVEMLQARTKKT